MAERRTRALTQPIRGRVVCKYLAQLSLALGVLSLVPIVVSLVYGEGERALWQALPVAILLAFGLACARLEAPGHIQPNEALVVPALVFLGAPLLFAVPLVAAGVHPVDAVFETISGITTTGLSVLPSVESRSHTFLFARAWLQWTGGLGIVVLALALFLGPGVTAVRFGAEQLEREDLVGSTRSHARRVLGVYVFLTVLGVLALYLTGMGGFDAVVHTLAAVSTGGFSSRDASLAAFSRSAATVVVLLGLLGAVSFSLYPQLRRGRIRALFADAEVRALMVCLVGVMGALTLFRVWAGGGGLARELPHAFWMAVSAQTTAGFATLSVSELDAGSKFSLIVAMLIGGDVGSTAGGMKIGRILILIGFLRVLVVRKNAPPHAVLEVRSGGRQVESGDLEAALGMILLFGVLIGVSWLPFLAAGYDPLDALFEVVSATGTVGLSAGIAHPDLEPGLKAVLCVDMWMGRLEVLALLVLLYPRTWIKPRAGTP